MVPDDGVYKLEFRRSVGTDTDLSLIAKEFGGGGHKVAAGATWRLNDVERAYLKDHYGDEGFDQMKYVAGIVVEKILESS